MPQNVLSQILIAAFLFAVLALLLWENTASQAPTAPGHVAEVDQRFTFFTAQQYNTTGARQWTLSGAGLQHYAGNRGYQMSQPKLLIDNRDASVPNWQLTAPEGTANEALTEIRFTGGVLGDRPAYRHQGTLQFRTEAMTIEPKTQTAHSTDASSFAELGPQSQPMWISQSTGFLLNYATERIDQRQVRDQFNRPSRDRASPPLSPSRPSSPSHGAPP